MFFVKLRWMCGYSLPRSRRGRGGFSFLFFDRRLDRRFTWLRWWRWLHRWNWGFLGFNS